MARVYFREDVGNVLYSLALEAERYHPDYRRALVQVGVALGVQLVQAPDPGTGADLLAEVRADVGGERLRILRGDV